MTRTTTRSLGTSKKPNTSRVVVRCAVYTRKSSEEGLEQEFNSLDAQRESGEAYIRSQIHEGWEPVPVQYDDGGFTGGNMDRPALKRLMTDIEAGKVDCVLVYKVDRLSRSLSDFGRLMETFDRHQVSFVSVTQQFNTSTSMGRLVLNVLLSFAQFEREIISERTRDKIAAARRKGKWSGGMPLLGFDIDPRGSKLVVHPDEAVRVREIFALYLQHQSLIRVIQELDQRGWTGKQWTTKKGRSRGGKPFTRTSLHKLLTNVTYNGQLRYRNEVHNGEQAAIVDAAVWQRVQALLLRNGRTGGAEVRNRFGALLKGLLRCSACDCAMTPTHSTKGGNKRYRYYVCCQAQKRGWQTCPAPSVPAHEIEQFVVNQIRRVGQDPELVRETIEQIHMQVQQQQTVLTSEQRTMERDLARWHAEIRNTAAHVPPGDATSPVLAHLADLHDRVRTGGRRLAEIGDQLQALTAQAITPTEAAQALSQFDPLWTSLTSREQSRVMQLLIERIDYDCLGGKVKIAFQTTGIKELGGSGER